MKKGKKLNQVHIWDSLHWWSPMILSEVTRGQRVYFVKRTATQLSVLACGSLALGISVKPWWWSGAIELGCTCSLTTLNRQWNDHSANGKNKSAIFFRNSQPISPFISSFKQTIGRQWASRLYYPSAATCCWFSTSLLCVTCVQLTAMFPKKLIQSSHWDEPGDLLGNG